MVDKTIREFLRKELNIAKLEVYFDLDGIGIAVGSGNPGKAVYCEEFGKETHEQIIEILKNAGQQISGLIKDSEKVCAGEIAVDLDELRRQMKGDG